ncbi:MAG: oxidoreductase [Candidatus Firestonebacteria bacterium RIFOXYC2_FULL_39_67]|nr:MAG: oxidoreductase [Candidatus Firestonebacteria bacterium RIFOXYD2_FULL_39_29]OGF54302.1 MAG: oxidoreductase [Candidatus Firestonebacteria bacterium RIFOXYC2_FULL_39_67]
MANDIVLEKEKKASLYEPVTGKIISVRQMTETEKWFKIELEGKKELHHGPGQFVEVSLLGIGEAPISISSSPTQKGYFELCVRKAGKVTTVLHGMKEGDEIGIRGPFGHGFPVDELKGKDLLFIAGGLGIAPLRSLINFVIDKRKDFGKVTILLGCKEPSQLLYMDEIEKWSKLTDVAFRCTVDKGAPDWKGNVGLITELIPGVDIDVKQTYSIVCGPPIMYKFVLLKLMEKNIPENQILLSLERRMKCGVGKCGHCQINKYYCCQDGPVFSYDKLKGLEGAL